MSIIGDKLLCTYKHFVQSNGHFMSLSHIIATFHLDFEMTPSAVYFWQDFDGYQTIQFWFVLTRYIFTQAILKHMTSKLWKVEQLLRYS